MFFVVSMMLKILFKYDVVVTLLPDKLFFIYVSKDEEWKKRYQEDWDYVSSMTRFFKWWIKHEFNEDLSVDVDILPVIPGKTV